MDLDFDKSYLGGGGPKKSKCTESNCLLDEKIGRSANVGNGRRAKGGGV